MSARLYMESVDAIIEVKIDENQNLTKEIKILWQTLATVIPIVV